MSSKLHTKRVFPYAVGRVDQPGRGNWTNPENAMQEGGEAASIFTPAGRQPYTYQSFMMKLDLPAYAKIEAARWLVRARLEAEEAESSSISLYSMFWFDESGALQSGRLDTLARFGHEWTTVMVDHTFAESRLVTNLNELRGIRDLFSIEARCNAVGGSPNTEDNTVFCDWLAIELDYSLPEFPLEMDLRIEE